jgi:hypothetical protein
MRTMKELMLVAIKELYSLHFQKIYNFSQEKIDEAVCFTHRVSRSVEFLQSLNVTNWKDSNIKQFQKQCWKGKPVVKDLVDELKLLFSTCVKNSEPFTTFLQHFAEKAFDFACNLEQENFVAYEDGKYCNSRLRKNFYEDCSAPYFPKSIQIFDQGLCE